VSKQKPESRAVVANGCSQGVALWWWGQHIDCEVDAFGDGLTDLGLDDAPHGVSVWEGHYVYTTVQYIEHVEHESAPVGNFRAPTDTEWDAIRRGVSPWADLAPWQDEAEVQP